MAEFTPRFVEAVSDTAKRWRRIVTGERDGRSIIAIEDDECPFQMGVEGATGVAVTDFWRTPLTPACAPEGSESCVLPLVFGPPEGGTLAQLLEWPPDRQLFGTDDPAVAKSVTAHQTSTIDYIHVLSGEIWVTLDEEERRLVAGDTLIQRGTRHGWSNRSDKPCRMFVVMVSATR